jgi:two-component system phosphate regulon sensor histidine kinase PhoR
MTSYKYRYAVLGTFFALIFCGLLFGLHYLISSGTPGQLLRDFPAAAILVFLTLPVGFLVGYFWGAEKDQRASIKFLTERQKEHEEMAESISGLLRQGEETRRLAEIVAQEMKHPLTSIVGYTLTLCEYWDKLDEDSRREFVDYIKVSASRLEGIANDLLRITEMASLAPRLEKEPVNLEEIAEEVRVILEEIYSERKVKVGLRFAEEPPQMRSDPSRLFDLLYNLLDICMRCSENDKIVSAWCSSKDRKLQLRLRCPHSTIAPDRIMRLEKWPPPEKEGEVATLGMEYRLAQHLLEEVGGTLKVDAMGKDGISFLVSLPLD